MLMNERSSDEPTAIGAPSDSARSAICGEVRVFVPSWIISIARRAVPGLACASAAKPASAISVKSTTGALCRSTTTISRPFDSFARDGEGSFSDGGAPVAGSLLRSTVLATVLNAGTGSTLSTKTPSDSQRLAAPCTSAGVALATQPRRVL